MCDRLEKSYSTTERGDKAGVEKVFAPGQIHYAEAPTASAELTLDNVEDAFTYHAWDARQHDRGLQVRDALVTAAKVMLRVVPRGPARTRALEYLRDARMLANHAITHDGRF